MAPLPVFSETSRSQLLVVVSVSHSNPISTSPGRFWRAAACSRGWFNTIHVPRARRSVFMGYYWDVNVSVRWDLWPDWGVRTWRPTAACADGDLYGSSLSWPCRVHADAATHGMGTPPGDSAVSTGQAASGGRIPWGGGLGLSLSHQLFSIQITPSTPSVLSIYILILTVFMYVDQ